MPVVQGRVSRSLSCCVLLSLLGGTPRAQTPASAKPSSARARRTEGTVAVRNPQIGRIISEIDARNIESTIRKLVSFGTRSTLSEQNNPNRGIGAARDWLYAEFQKAAVQSGGRMTVEKQPGYRSDVHKRHHR